MNILAWMLSISVLIFLLIESVAFHKATVCRQEGWLKSTELRTHALLYRPGAKERTWHLRCRMVITRNHSEIHWQKLPSLSRKNFTLPLDGKL